MIKKWIGSWERLLKIEEKLEARRKRQRVESILKECGCICYCPECMEPLNDQADCVDGALVYYKCNKCGYQSEWNFDMAPVPICLK